MFFVIFDNLQRFGFPFQTFETIKKIQLEKYYETTDPALREKIIINPYQIFHMALANSKPFLETTPVKRGGATYQVPVPVRETRQSFLALKWLIEAALDKPDDMRFYTKMAHELLDAANNTVSIFIVQNTKRSTV